MNDNLPKNIHNFFCFNIPTRAAYDRDPDEPLRQADVKACYEEQAFAPLPSLAKLTNYLLHLHGDGEFTFDNTYLQASSYEVSALQRAIKAVFEGPRYQGVPPDETWFCGMRAEQIATLNLMMPPYNEVFWSNLASKLYVKGSREQLKKMLDEHQQAMRNLYAFLDAAVHQIHHLDVPEDMFVVPQEPPPGWKPYRAEGGVKELKALYHAPPPPIIPSPYDHGVAPEAVEAPVPAPVPVPYDPAEPILLPTTTIFNAPVEPIAPVPSELEYPASTQSSDAENMPVNLDDASDSTPSTIRAPKQGVVSESIGKGKGKMQEDSVLEMTEPQERHIDAIDPALLTSALEYRPLTEEKRAYIESWRQEVAKKGLSPEAPEINDGFKAPSWASHLRKLHENPPKLPESLVEEPTRKLVLKTSGPKKSKNKDVGDGTSRQVKTIPWLQTRIGKRTGGAPKRASKPESTANVPEGASTSTDAPLPLPSAFKFLNAKTTPFAPPKQLLSFPDIETFDPAPPTLAQPTPFHTVMAYTGHAQFLAPAGSPSSHGSMPGLLPHEPQVATSDGPTQETTEGEKVLARYRELQGIAEDKKMSVDGEEKGSYEILLPVPPYANEDNSFSNAFEYRYVAPNNSDASGSTNLAICAPPPNTIDASLRGDAIPDIEDIVPDPSRGRKIVRSKKRNADGEIIGRLASSEREEGRQKLLPRQIKNIPLKRVVERKPTPHPSASVMPVPTRIIRQDLNFPRAQGIDLDD
ncbi:hypothetical protein SCHPADRAFT_947745 [Schizopora paradoxa]|uniref:Uncharacterized protein n=1 Tax=Schizopora paradoxa TaxID=27342 RepID=A0A0H2R4G8_9AGAM|nr:hypothetical protein SCHPADRAFT_947745 [Schizopora paradoxa]